MAKAKAGLQLVQKDLAKLVPQTEAQQLWKDTIECNTISFGLGPAGCGKTHIPVAMAVEGYIKSSYDKIVIVRPAIEACHEKLGSLPGDMFDKMSPYLQSVFDCMYDYWTPNEILRLVEENQIEIVPISFMRGRTFKDAFIIADESQNLTEDMMLMLITRLGKGSKMVIEGDLDQNDLPKNSKSGLHKALKLVGLVEDVGVFQFTSRDIVRHPLLQPIIEAWPTL